MFYRFVILCCIFAGSCADIERYTKCNFLEKIIKNAEECNYDPDDYLDVPQMIARHGYRSETHVVKTEDGYLLKVHRIPSKKTEAQPVFLQHGLLGSSADWIINVNQSLAFFLADNGYDVWLGNARGNTYSKAHVSVPVDTPTFWNFSFHEMGTMDLPAVLYYITNTTEKAGDLIYVGHSMGTTMFFAFSSLRPQAAKSVKLMVALAPVAYMTHIKSPIRYLAPFSYDYEWVAKHLGLNQFLPSNKILKFLQYDCRLFQINRSICENLIFTLCGFDKEEFNKVILDSVLSKEPAGTSTKTVIHYAQEIQHDGDFQQFDYGPKGNLIQYGTKDPPKYNITNIKRPIYMMYGPNDWLANIIDIKKLASNITNLVGVYKVQLDSFNHVDFLFGKDARKLVYEPLLNVIRNYTTA